MTGQLVRTVAIESVDRHALATGLSVCPKILNHIIICDSRVGGLIRGGVTDVDEQERASYDRSKLRYPSDLTDDEWGWSNG